MPDNVGYTAGIGTKIASREVSYSGETAQAQAVGLMTFSGGDDAKTAADVDASNPLPMYRRDPSTATSFGPITTANTVLFAAIDTADENVVQLQISGSFAGGVFLQSSMDNSTWFSCRALSINNDLSASDTVFAQINLLFLSWLDTLEPLRRPILSVQFQVRMHSDHWIQKYNKLMRSW